MYIKYMGRVDCNDQLIKYSAFSHRTCKWWKKVLFRLLNLAVVNSYITYSERVALKGKKKLSQTNFRTEVLKQMIKSATLDLTRPTPGRPSTSGLELQRLTSHHFPRKIEGNTKNRISRSCKVCVPAERSVDIAIGQKHKRPGHDTSYKCAQCVVSLFLVPCFSMIILNNIMKMTIKHGKKLQNKTLCFYSSVIFSHTNFFQVFYPATELCLF